MLPVADSITIAQNKPVRIEDSGHALEAAIMRLMKHNKRFEHAELITEAQRVMSSSYSINIDTKTVKKHIESLIDRSYMERDTDNPKLYAYVP